MPKMTVTPGEEAEAKEERSREEDPKALIQSSPEAMVKREITECN
jgi:hypothetical protein